MSVVLDREEVIDEVEEIEIGDNGIPKKLWVGYHRISNRYACHGGPEGHGLAVGSTEGSIIRLMEFIELSGLTTKQVSFEEACEIALERPLPVNGIMLIDSIKQPLFLKLR